MISKISNTFSFYIFKKGGSGKKETPFFFFLSHF